MVALYSCLYSVKHSSQGQFTYSAERQPVGIPSNCDITGPGSKGYMLNPETAVMMLMTVSAYTEAIVVSNISQDHRNRLIESREESFACEYLLYRSTTWPRLPISLLYAQ